MRSVLQFVTRQLATRAFWWLVATTLLGLLLNDLRNSFKDRIFQEAIADLKAHNWPGWKTAGTQNATRF